MTAHARELWLEHSEGGGALTWLEWCEALDEAEAERVKAEVLRVKVRAVLDDAEWLAAVLADVEAG